MYLLDTNVISEMRRKCPEPAVVRWLNAQPDEALYVSVLVLGAILKGGALAARRDPMAGQSFLRWYDAVLARFGSRQLGVDLAVAEAWGRLAAIRPLPVIDGLLAATAKVHGMTLVTRNIRDVAGLDVALVTPWASDT